jgi:hypothetical protein
MHILPYNYFRILISCSYLLLELFFNVSKISILFVWKVFNSKECLWNLLYMVLQIESKRIIATSKSVFKTNK